MGIKMRMRLPSQQLGLRLVMWSEVQGRHHNLGHLTIRLPHSGSTWWAWQKRGCPRWFILAMGLNGGEVRTGNWVRAQ